MNHSSDGEKFDYSVFICMGRISRLPQKVLNRVSPYLLPYNLYNSIVEKRTHFFVDSYCNYKKRAERVAESLNKNYKTVVSVQGFGFSGSGAVLDLLCETNVCDVVGTVPNSKNKEDHESLESDFLRVAGGLFELEKYLDSKNVFQKDAVIKRFIRYLENYSLFKNDSVIQQLFFEFFDKVVDLKIIDLKRVSYNTHLYGKKKQDAIFFLRSMSVTDYRSISKETLTKFFNHINKKEKEILVFDQLLCDFEFDTDRYQNYIPDCKIITVYRDPRDVYAFACERNVEWIAHDNVCNFIKWYKIMVQSLDFNNTNYLTVEFESLINDYERELDRIFGYLGISQDSHDSSRKRLVFNPDYSRKNIGVWKNSVLSKSDFAKIYSELSKYCYTK